MGGAALNLSNDELLPKVAAELRQGWGVSIVPGSPSDWEVVRAALEERILYLLRHDPRKLASVLLTLYDERAIARRKPARTVAATR